MIGAQALLNRRSERLSSILETTNALVPLVSNGARATVWRQTLSPAAEKEVPIQLPRPSPCSVYRAFSATVFLCPHPTPQRCQNGGGGGMSIFTYRVEEGAKAEARAIEWRQKRLKCFEKAPPRQLLPAENPGGKK